MFFSQVNLGVVDADPSSTAGTIKIMEHLHQYVAHLPDDSLYSTLTNGDGASIEKMIHAHRSRRHDGTAKGRLDALIESPQEFHKELLLLQVSEIAK